MEKKVSVVIPAYNEEETIKEVITGYKSIRIVDEIVVVDNNSKDKTAQLARGAGARVVRETKQGYGYALQKGMREARGDIIVLTESDMTFDAKDVYKLLSYIDDVDLVLGTRTNPALIHEGANMGWFLRFGNIFIAKLICLLFSSPPLTDVGCTMRAIRKKSLAKIIDKFEVGASHFSPEMMVESLKNNLTIIEIPLNYRKRRGESKITGNKIRAFTVGLKMIWIIFKKRFISN